MKGIIRERRETEWEKIERETNHERPLTLGNPHRAAEGEAGGGDGVTGCRALRRARDGMSTGGYTIVGKSNLNINK